MASTHRKDWATLKKQLAKETQKALSKAKADLGPNLDKYEKCAAKFQKEFDSLGPADGATKAMSKLIDEMQSLYKKIDAAVDSYVEICQDAMDPKRSAVKKKLEKTRKTIETELNLHKRKYADAGQRVTNLTFEFLLGKDWVKQLNTLKAHKSDSVKTFCTHEVFAMSAPDMKPNPKLKKLQSSAAKQLKAYGELCGKLQAAAGKKLKSRDEAVKLLTTVYYKMSDALCLDGGVIEMVREWIGLQEKLAGREGMEEYKRSKQGKAAWTILEKANKVLGKDFRTTSQELTRKVDPFVRGKA